MRVIYFLLTLQLASAIKKRVIFHTDEGENRVDPNEYCLSFNKDKCEICVDSLLVNFQCVPLEKKINHCLSYESADRCEVCQYNFTPSKDNSSCDKITQKNCIEYNTSDDKCLLCSPGILIKDDKCESQNKCSLANCMVCNNFMMRENCEVCENGYALTTKDDLFICVKENENNSNCAILDFDSSKCQICQLGYFMNKEQKCVLSNAYHIDLFGNSFIEKIIKFLVIAFIIFN